MLLVALLPFLEVLLVHLDGGDVVLGGTGDGRGREVVRSLVAGEAVLTSRCVMLSVLHHWVVLFHDWLRAVWQVVLAVDDFAAEPLDLWACELL